jgi:long-chain acyl-CoA synthetase
MFPGAYDPDRIAITMAGSHSQLTYGEVEAFSNQFAHLCRRHGLKQGDGIALCLENHLYFLPICWGAFRAGLYFTAISYRLQPAEVEYIVNDSGAKILITSAHLTEQFEALAPNLVNEPACYMLDGQSAKASSLLDALSELPATRIPDET